MGIQCKDKVIEKALNMLKAYEGLHTISYKFCLLNQHNAFFWCSYSVLIYVIYPIIMSFFSAPTSFTPIMAHISLLGYIPERAR